MGVRSQNSGVQVLIVSRTRKFVTLVAIALAHALAVSPARAVEHAEMVGCWYGEYQYDPVVFARFLTERRANGELVVTYRYYKDGATLSEHINVGAWELRGGRYFTRYTVINGRPNPKPQENEYEVIQFTGSELHYRSARDDPYQGVVYRVRRVDADYTLP